MSKQVSTITGNEGFNVPTSTAMFSFNEDAENASFALRGVAGVLSMLAAGCDEWATHKYTGEALTLLAQVTDSINARITDALESNEL